MPTIQFRGTRQDVRLVAAQLVAILAGRQPDVHGIARGFQLAIGFAALSDIKDAFIIKSRGGTDAMGIRWPPLSREYLAYGRRFGPGEQSRLKQGAGLGRAHSKAPGGRKGLLTAAQLKQWRKIYVRLLNRFILSEGEAEAKSHAAAIAWSVLKRHGAKTKLEVFGNRQVDILRDTGILLNSLSPGILSGSGPSVNYSPPSSDGGAEQIFDLQPGEVIVGTNVEYASAHQKGIGVPQRKFLPDEANPVPTVWWARWLAVANAALVVSVAFLFQRSRA